MAFEDYRVAEQTLAPDDVLELILDDLRFWYVEPKNPLTRDTSISTLHKLLGTFDYWELGRRLNQQFSICASKGDWMGVLYPASEHTVGEMCDFVALRAKRAVIEPVSLGGSVSPAAGAFFAVRQTLRGIGADVSDLHPSSSLQPYLRQHPDAFVHLSHLAPGRLPRPTVDSPWHGVFWLAAFALGWTGFAGAMFHQWHILLNRYTAAAWICQLAHWAAQMNAKPREVRLSWLSDFRDLSRVLAGERDGCWPGFEVIYRAQIVA